ncbi:MAG TPA: rod shape-determining protein MreC [Casimicrobiaceae bacterium]|jgi:rod shape-determining protein MreC|nr:rod shape-determining protein MreC [Casimicrobiaceae bacterium]
MRHLSVEPPPFFHRGPSPLARLAFFGLLSLALLFADTRYRYLENVRQAVASALYPVQRIVLMPGEAVAYVTDYLTAQRTLADDNATLKQDLLAEAPAVQGYQLLQQENARLRALLEVEQRIPRATTAAEVLYTGRDPFTQKVFVDKGESVGVQPGQAVIDEVGVVGQVTRVFPYMAEVTLVTDKDYAVPVRVERSGVRSVMYGAGTGRLPELRFLSPNSEIHAGDRLVTSGIDGTYPAGLAVAQVVSVERETGQIFARVICRPLGGVDKSTHVLILGRVAALPRRPEEATDVEPPRKLRNRIRE